MIQYKFLVKHRQNAFRFLYSPQNYILGRLPSTCKVTNDAVQQRFYSNPARRPNFFSQFLENIKQEMAKNKEMKERQITEELGKSARGAAERVTETSQKLGQSGAFQTLSQTAKVVKKELDTTSMDAKVYRPPARLRKRVETLEEDSRVLQPNTEATGVELHKDSRFYQSWQNFKENNPYVNKVLDWKTQYDESDNPVIRASRMLTDKVSDIMGGLFQKTELSETMTELCSLDPSFDKVQFLRQCETDIIPNILEAIVRGDLEILRDWCHDAPYNILSTPLRQAISLGYKFDSKVIDIDNVDLAMGKVMEQGPVLIISFTSQQILCLRDKNENVVEGDPEKILRVNYVWVLCRDRSEMNPRAAWRLLDLSATSTEQFV
ncbi:Mitochondrial import inner membrane translocase subunit TIM44 [Gryllus bimaculatus]|nr:Mitochondrial import inner membrane translocase subunit TIM44 [Gryllus bimaculatus]